jgi:phosphoglycolate phosphatase
VEHFFGKSVFEQVVGVVEKVPVKPGPEAATKLMAQMGVAKEHCWLVGDSGIDMDTAVAAGMRGIGVTWGFRPCHELLEHGADVVVDSPEEVLEVVGT